MQQAQQKWLGQGLAVITVDTGEKASVVQTFMKSHSDFTCPVFTDADQQVSGKYAVTAYPTTFFIDRNGVISEIRVGAFSSIGMIETSVNKILY